MNIGTRMKNRRKELGLSADKLASMIGKDRSTVFRYERGDIENLPLDILEPIAKALLTTPAYLMGWEDDNEKTATPKDSGMSEAKQQLFALAESCSDEEASRLLQMMELFLGKR
jgi:repressor LexA